MSSKENIIDNEPKKGMTAEQIGLLVVMIGVVLMAVGIYTTEKLISFYFNIGLSFLVLGSLLFAMFTWARGYQMSHMTIPLPDVVREMLRSGGARRNQSIQEKSGFSPRPAYQTARTASTQPLHTHKPEYVQPAPAPGFVNPQPYQAPAEPFAPTPSPIPQPQTEPTPVTPPPIAPVPPPVQAPEPKKPEPKKEEYMDVLEEADKEFESYIDKLIEE